MARTCPKCGTENPDYSFYCSKCTTDLRSRPEDVAREVPAIWPRISAQLDEPTEIRRALAGVNRVLLLASGIMVLLHIPAMLKGGEDAGWIRLSFLAFLMLFVAATYSAKIVTNNKHVQFMRHRDFVGKAFGEIKGFNLILVWYAIAILAILVIAQAMTSSSTGILALSVVLSVAVTTLIFFSIIIASKVTIEPDGISVGSPTAIVRRFFPFRFLEKVTVSTQMMTIKLNPTAPWSSIPRRIVLREDPSALALAIRQNSPSTPVMIDSSVSANAQAGKR